VRGKGHWIHVGLSQVLTSDYGGEMSGTRVEIDKNELLGKGRKLWIFKIYFC